MIKWQINNGNQRYTTEEMFNAICTLMIANGIVEAPSRLLTFGAEANRLYKVGETNTIGGYIIERIA